MISQLVLLVVYTVVAIARTLDSKLNETLREMADPPGYKRKIIMCDFNVNSIVWNPEPSVPDGLDESASERLFIYCLQDAYLVTKLTTVDIMDSDHDNDMHTDSDNGNELQPIVNMCNDILCDENGSDSDIDSIYNVVCNIVLDLNTFEQVFQPCPSDSLYNVDYMSPCSGLLSSIGNYFPTGWEILPRGELR